MENRIETKHSLILNFNLPVRETVRAFFIDNIVKKCIGFQRIEEKRGRKRIGCLQKFTDFLQELVSQHMTGLFFSFFGGLVRIVRDYDEYLETRQVVEAIITLCFVGILVSIAIKSSGIPRDMYFLLMGVAGLQFKEATVLLSGVVWKKISNIIGKGTDDKSDS